MIRPAAPFVTLGSKSADNQLDGGAAGRKERTMLHTHETKGKVRRGKWAAGGMLGVLEHFWPADHPTTLCGTTFHRHDEMETFRRCEKCIASYARITSIKPPQKKQRFRITYPSFRKTITELVDTMKTWQEWEQTTVQAGVMIQALWILNLAGVDHSGIPKETSIKVMNLMRNLAKGDIHAQHALELLKGWETNG